MYTFLCLKPDEQPEWCNKLEKPRLTSILKFRVKWLQLHIKPLFEPISEFAASENLKFTTKVDSSV